MDKRRAGYGQVGRGVSRRCARGGRGYACAGHFPRAAPLFEVGYQVSGAPCFGRGVKRDDRCQRPGDNERVCGREDYRVSVCRLCLRFLHGGIVHRIGLLAGVPRRVVRRRIVITEDRRCTIGWVERDSRVSRHRRGPSSGSAGRRPTRFVRVIPRDRFDRNCFLSLSIILTNSSVSSFTLLVSSFTSFAPSLGLFAPLPEPHVDSKVFFPPGDGEVADTVVVRSRPLNEGPGGGGFVVECVMCVDFSKRV